MVENDIRPKVSLSEPIQENAIPENNLNSLLDRSMYARGVVTHTSTIKEHKPYNNKSLKEKKPDEASDEDSQDSVESIPGKDTPAVHERSLADRGHRRALLLEYKATKDREKRQEILQRAKAMEEISAQWLVQHEVTVELEELGEQMSRVVTLEPPEAVKTPETEKLAPIFIIPGISNDPGAVEYLAKYLALQGRRVTVVGYPEGTLGRVTAEFTHHSMQNVTDVKEGIDKVSYEPHISFFKEVYKHLVPQGQDAELWGYSTGGPIVAEILNDPEFQARIPEAVLIGPAGTYDQAVVANFPNLFHSRGSIFGGVYREIKPLLTNRLQFLPFYALIMGHKKGYPVIEGQDALKSSVMRSLLGKISYNCDHLFSSARVQEGGSIVLLSGGADLVTKSARSEAQLAQNPQIRIVHSPEMMHVDPVTNCSEYMPKVFAAQIAQNQSVR